MRDFKLTPDSEEAMRELAKLLGARKRRPSRPWRVECWEVRDHLVKDIEDDWEEDR